MANKNAANKGKTGRAGRDGRADFVGYVNLTLTEEDRIDFEGYVGEADVVAEAYMDALDIGYQFTTKFDAESDCYSVSVSTWRKNAEDSGVIYTARSSDPNQALSKAVYVWDRKLERNLNNGAVKGTRKDAF